MSIYESFASSFTQNTLAATRTILSSGGVHVYGWAIKNTSGAAVDVDFRTGDASTDTYITVTIPDDETVISDTSWLAANGLSVLIPAGGSAAVEFTVFHNNLSGAA